MKLVEKKVYFARVGLFCFNFNEHNGIFGNGDRVLTGCPLFFDQITDDGWYIFQVLDKNKMGVRVPNYDIENEISENPIENCELVLEKDEIEYYLNYNKTIEEENGET